MLKNLTLRWKILIALLSLSVIPLVVSLVIMNGLIERQLDRDMQQRAKGVVNFALKNVETSQRELANYIQFLAGNTDMVNSIYYASLTGDNEQIKRVVEGMQKNINLNTTLVVDKTGKVLLQSGGDSGKEGELNLADMPTIKEGLAGNAKSSIERFNNRLCLITVAPVKLQAEQIGALAAVVFLDDAYATPLKNLSGADVAFYDNGKVEAASLPELRSVNLPPLLADGQGVATLGSADYVLYISKLEGKDRGILLAIDNTENISARRHFRLLIFVIVAVAAALSLLVGLTISHGIVRPLFAVVANLKEIAEGEGDLTRTLEVSSHDEVGVLAENFNRFVARLREMVQRTRTASGDLTLATERLRRSSREVSEGAQQQSQSLE
ncbi:MAG TPA: hypothetical protein DCF93_07200, partial [Desulfuromonas sp.]|nr:hypothetical protein [Desulfuromonas sp.]